jgi:plasmid stability protein
MRGTDTHREKSSSGNEGNRIPDPPEWVERTCYREISLEVMSVTDILVRGVPDDVVSALDARAAKLGLSRTEFLRRRLAQEATPSESLSIDDFIAFSDTFADLGDPEVMKGAWA